MTLRLPGWVCGRREPVTPATPGSHRASMESLECRRLLSASLAGAFNSDIPAMLLPGVKNTVTLRVTDSGDARATGPVNVSLYASSSPSLDAGSFALASVSKLLHLKARGSTAFQFRLTAPASVPDGNYYLVARIDATRIPQASPAIATAPAPRPTGFQHPFAELSGRLVSQPIAPLVAGRRHAAGKASVLVFNRGNVTAHGPLAITFYSSADGVLDAADPVIASMQTRDAGVKAGNSKIFSANLVLPPGTAPGSYRLFAVMASGGSTIVSPTGNVTMSPTPLLVAVAPPVIDLRHNHPDDGNGDAADSGDGVDIGDAAVGLIDAASSRDIPPTDTSGNGNVPPDTAPSDPGNSTDSGGEGSGGSIDPGGSTDSGSGDSGGSSSGGGDFGGSGSGGGNSGGGGDF